MNPTVTGCTNSADMGGYHLLVVDRLRLKLRRLIKKSTRRRLALDISLKIH